MVSRRDFLRSAAAVAVASVFPLPVAEKRASVLVYGGTVTGRWSSIYPNRSNFPQQIRKINRAIPLWEESLGRLSYSMQQCGLAFKQFEDVLIEYDSSDPYFAHQETLATNSLEPI